MALLGKQRVFLEMRGDVVCQAMDVIDPVNYLWFAITVIIFRWSLVSDIATLKEGLNELEGSVVVGPQRDAKPADGMISFAPFPQTALEGEASFTINQAG